MRCTCEKPVVVKSTRGAESASRKATARKSIKRAKPLSVMARKAERGHARA